jgi:Tfp pilus assembly protein PilZ
MRSASHFFVDRHGDITGGGIFVATTRELDVDQQILVEVALHSYVLLLRGRVRWRSGGDETSPAGIGVTFEDLTVPARWVIESFCARRPAARWDLETPSAANGY